MTTGLLSRKCEALASFDFSDDVIEAFTEGDCWALAHEISALTGWGIFAVGGQYDYDSAETVADRGWDHMFVRHPSGYLVDIEGVHTDKAMVDYWFPQGHALVYESSDPGHLYNAGDRQFENIDPKTYAHRVIWEAEEYFNSREFMARETF